MVEKQQRFWLAVIFSAIILAGAVIWRVAIFKPALQSHPEHHHSTPLLLEPPTEDSGQLPKTDAESAGGSKLSLNDVIKARRYWKPILTNWVGKAAPDFTLTDINGKEHKLSDYRGKDVLITFWATWCFPCLIEIPHLVALRNVMSKEEVGMLAISFIDILSRETPEKVKAFVENSQINYTVISADISAVTRPYNQIPGFPTAFFIDKEGKIKLITNGALNLGEMKAILLAE